MLLVRLHGMEDRETGGQLYLGVRVALSDLLNQTGRALKQEHYCALSCGVSKNMLARTACALREVYTNVPGPSFTVMQLFFQCRRA